MNNFRSTVRNNMNADLGGVVESLKTRKMVIGISALVNKIRNAFKRKWVQRIEVEKEFVIRNFLCQPYQTERNFVVMVNIQNDLLSFQGYIVFYLKYKRRVVLLFLLLFS